MARDDFSRATLDLLGKRVGVRCSNPSCRKLTTGPRTDSRYIVNIGVAAHITAASKGGPRFASNLSTEERQAPENGIWLCQNCAKLVDNDPARYAIEVLRTWKSGAEDAALAEVEGRAEQRLADSTAEVELRFRVEHQTAARHDYFLEVLLRNLGNEPLGPYHIDLELPRSVVHDPDGQYMVVRDRSTRETAFFRVDQEKHRRGDVVYPGDAKVVLSIRYFMDHSLFNRRGALFEQPVKVTLYQHGFHPIIVERPFAEFQQF